MASLEFFCRGILGGVMIGIGGTVYLSCENTYVGALLFAVGLFTILAYGLKLFTGMAGYLPKCRGLLEVWLGNLTGTAIMGLALGHTRVLIAQKAVKIAEVKLGDTPLSIFILAVCCGALMYIAVDYYQKKGSMLGVFLAVPTFILCGFEHCVANMFYFTLAGAWSIKAVGYLLLMSVGNAVGAVAFRLLSEEQMYRKKELEQSKGA